MRVKRDKVAEFEELYREAGLRAIESRGEYAMMNELFPSIHGVAFAKSDKHLVNTVDVRDYHFCWLNLRTIRANPA
jgi:hypothetical protein